MRSFDVDTNDGLLSSRRTEDDIWWHQAEKQQQAKSRHRAWLIAVTAVALLGLALGLAAVGTASVAVRRASTAGWRGESSRTNAATSPGWDPISSIAFSSCTSYDVRPQPIWTQGVIPSAPDAWVWLGDFAYFDDPLLNCNLVPSYPECNCTADFMRRPPFQCFAGVAEHARLRVQLQLGIREYQRFLAFMCPGYQKTGSFPPLGTDPSMCPRPIFGVYDDHDSGWNNGNARNPSKDVIKNIFLDGIGEAHDSPRRSTSNGLQVAYTLPGPAGSTNKAGLKDEINLVLLDERYFRDTLPCSAREDWCRQVLRTATSSAGDVAWCEDYIGDETAAKPGSCCRKDDEWDDWCSKADNTHARWSQLCDPTSSVYAQSTLILDTDNKTVLDLTDDLWDNQQKQLWHRLLEGASSPMCEVLGLQQRQWLQQQLQGSNAALNIIASGSVVAGSLGFVGPGNTTTCSGDDFLCWPRAQVNLLHTVANVSGCTVLLVGDYHYSDLKVIQPGAEHAYAKTLQTHKLSKPVYQAMASGMTYSTAEHKVLPCHGSFREDLVGLRPGGSCSYVPQPAFGMLEVDWKQRVVVLSVRNHSSGAVASGYDGSKQLIRFDLDSCRPL